MENQIGRKVKFLRSHKGGKYTSSKFNEYLASDGIEHQLTIPGQSEQNGVAERMNQTPTEHAGDMIYRLTCQKIFRQRQ